MKKLIIPRGASPRLYRKLVASGQVKGEYREIEAPNPKLPKPRPPKIQYVTEGADPRKQSKPRKRKPAAGYQGGDRGFDDAGR